MYTISEEDAAMMWDHYISRKKYNQSVASDSQDGLYSAGECREAERWLKLLGMDTSYERVQAAISER
jgi:hypothetical protein